MGRCIGHQVRQILLFLIFVITAHKMLNIFNYLNVCVNRRKQKGQVKCISSADAAIWMFHLWNLMTNFDSSTKIILRSSNIVGNKYFQGYTARYKLLRVVEGKLNQ